MAHDLASLGFDQARPLKLTAVAAHLAAATANLGGLAGLPPPDRFAGAARSFGQGQRPRSTPPAHCRVGNLVEPSTSPALVAAAAAELT